MRRGEPRWVSIVIMAMTVLVGYSGKVMAQDCTPGEARWCSTAPCYAGVQYCMEGGVWGPCVDVDVDDSAIVPDGNPCTEDLCDQGVPYYPPLPAGTECPEGECDGDGACVPVAAVEDVSSSNHRLWGNAPNPFNPRTVIHFRLTHEERVQLDVYDVAGRIVASLVADNVFEEGEHRVTWGGRDNLGRTVPSGTYFYRLTAGDYIETKRMTLIR